MAANPAALTPIERLDDLNRRALEGGGAARVQKQHEAGKLTDRKSVV